MRKSWSRHSVDEVNCSSEGIGPESGRYVGFSEKSKAGFDNVSMSSFSKAIVFWRMRRRSKMSDAFGG